VVSALIEALQRGDAVIFLEIRRFGRNLRRVERNLFRIFLRLDFDEAFNWLFHCFRQIVQRFDFFPVHFCDRQIG
jgi:hypothetical protein